MESQMQTKEIKKELPKNKKIKMDFSNTIYATGRRKKSIAKVWLKKGTGSIFVNGKKMNEYFSNANMQISICRPFSVVKRENEYDVISSVRGGGLTGQAGAITLGVSRALVKLEGELKSALKKEKLTTRDSRAVERKKYGLRKARRSFQFSKR